MRAPAIIGMRIPAIIAGDVGDARRGLLVCCDGELDEAVTEFACEGLRPVASRSTAAACVKMARR